MYSEKELETSANIKALQVNIEHITKDIGHIKKDMNIGFSDLKETFNTYITEERKEMLNLNLRMNDIERTINEMKQKQFKTIVFVSILGIIVGSTFALYDKLISFFLT